MSAATTSAPLVAALVDVTGLVIYFTIRTSRATWCLAGVDPVVKQACTTSASSVYKRFTKALCLFNAR